MKIKIYYRRNLKLSPAKLAAVCTHIGTQLGYMESELGEYNDPKDNIVIVLKASDKKYYELKEDLIVEDVISHVHIDIGLREVDPETEVAFGYLEWYNLSIYIWKNPP